MPQVVAQVIIGLVISTILGAISRALSPKPKKQSNKDEGRKQVIRSSIEAHQIIYGTSMESGPLVLGETTGENKEFLHLVVPLAAHEAEAIDSVFLGDVEITNGQLDGSGVVTSGPFASKVRITKHLGSDTQVADTNLVSEVGIWTTDHRGRGLSYLYLRFTGDVDVFPTGIPNIRAVVRGRKVWDPRNDPGDPSVRAFSNNAALCQLDYLMSSFGFAVPLTEINEASWIAAANVCDETVSLKAGGTQPRYTCDGSFQVDQKPADIMEDLLTASAGTVVYQQGTLRGYAGAATTATNTLDESDLRGPISPVTPRPSISESFNAIRGTFVDADDAKAPYSLTEFPPITNATFEAEDNGERVFSEIELLFTTNKVRAQRIANLFLQRARQGIVFTFPAKLSKLELAAWDVVTVTIARLGWSGKEFRILQWELSEDGGVNLTLQEEAAAVYTFDPNDEITIDPAPDTNLPDPFTVGTPGGIGFAEELRTTASGTIVTVVTATVVLVEDNFVNEYELEFKKSTDTDFIGVGRQTSNIFEILTLEDGLTYNFRARAINALGVKSSFVTANHQVAGQSLPPSDVVNFAINTVAEVAHLTWDAVADLDLSHYRVRWSPLIVGAAWANAVDLVSRVPRPATSVGVPARVGSYLIKAVDLKGNQSTNATIIATTVSGIAGLNVVETQSEQPAFSGAKTNVVAIDSILKLDTTNLFDSVAGNFDSALGLFDGGGGTGNFVTQGTYDFATVIDLTAVFTSRVTASITATADDNSDTFDSAPGTFDDREGLFDGETPSFVNAKLQISTTEDDPSGAPVWSPYRDFVVGDYKARGLRFRAVLTSSVTSATPIVSALTVTVDMPDRTAAADDIVVSASGSAITFSPAFKVLQGLGIAAQDLATGDYWAITAKSATGFTIRFFNSSDVGISRSFDYVAKGYGSLAT